MDWPVIASCNNAYSPQWCHANDRHVCFIIVHSNSLCKSLGYWTWFCMPLLCPSSCTVLRHRWQPPALARSWRSAWAPRRPFARGAPKLLITTIQCCVGTSEHLYSCTVHYDRWDLHVDNVSEPLTTSALASRKLHRWQPLQTSTVHSHQLKPSLRREWPPLRPASPRCTGAVLHVLTTYCHYWCTVFFLFFFIPRDFFSCIIHHMDLCRYHLRDIQNIDLTESFPNSSAVDQNEIKM